MSPTLSDDPVRLGNRFTFQGMPSFREFTKVSLPPYLTLAPLSSSGSRPTKLCLFAAYMHVPLIEFLVSTAGGSGRVLASPTNEFGLAFTTFKVPLWEFWLQLWLREAVLMTVIAGEWKLPYNSSPRHLPGNNGAGKWNVGWYVSCCFGYVSRAHYCHKGQEMLSKSGKYPPPCSPPLHTHESRACYFNMGTFAYKAVLKAIK